MLLLTSQDHQSRRQLLQLEIVHGLIQITLNACKEEDKPSVPPDQNSSVAEERAYVKDAVQTLYNLANFDRPRCYIPGETVRQSKDRRKFMLWGGLVALRYLSEHAKVKEISEFCEVSRLKDLEIRDLEDCVKVLKLSLEGIDEKKDKTAQLARTLSSLQAVNQAEEDKLEPEAGAIPTQDERVPSTTNKLVSLDSSTPQDVCFPEYAAFTYHLEVSSRFGFLISFLRLRKNWHENEMTLTRKSSKCNNFRNLRKKKKLESGRKTNESGRRRRNKPSRNICDELSSGRKKRPNNCAASRRRRKTECEKKRPRRKV